MSTPSATQHFSETDARVIHKKLVPCEPPISLPAKLTAGMVRDQLNKILTSRIFKRGRSAETRSATLLRYLTENTLAGNMDALDQRQIGVIVFNNPDYNPLIDAHVRIEGSRLRDRLREYYDELGRDDAVRLVLTPGSYVVHFRLRRTIDSLHSNPVAFDLYQKGRVLWEQRTPDSLSQAKSCFERALVIDPEYAAAHAALAECYAFMGIWGFRPSDVMPMVKHHAEQALIIDPDDATAHAAIGLFKSAYELDWQGGDECFRRALQIDRRCLGAYLWYSSCLLAQERTAEAILQCRRAQKVETTVSIVVNAHVAKILNVAGRHDEAETLLRRIIDQAPAAYIARWHLGLLFLETGRVPEAINELESAINAAGRGASLVASLGCAYARADRIGDATALLNELLIRRGTEYLPATDIAGLCAYLGDFDGAFSWLDIAYRERALFLTWLKVWPLFKPLRHDTRYDQMIQRIGLSKRSTADLPRKDRYLQAK